MFGMPAPAAIVTGGGGGVGRAASFALSRAGYAVLVLDLDGRMAEAVAADIRATGSSARGLRFDVMSERVADAIVPLAAKRPPRDKSGRYLATEYRKSWG